jgi:superoxide dismutase, Cu-Zn family
MHRSIALMLAVFAPAAALAASAPAGKTVTINSISASGIGAAIGTITLRETPQGLLFDPKLSSLPPGPHGFHVHANGDCGPGPGANNAPAPGMAAGGHFDPKTTGKHLGPHNVDGHLGDVPVLMVDADGMTRVPMIAKRLKLKDVVGHALMIHAGGDNFDDQPAPLGGGGGRIACGVVK